MGVIPVKHKGKVVGWTVDNTEAPTCPWCKGTRIIPRHDCEPQDVDVTCASCGRAEPSAGNGFAFLDREWLYREWKGPDSPGVPCGVKAAWFFRIVLAVEAETIGGWSRELSFPVVSLRNDSWDTLDVVHRMCGVPALKSFDWYDKEASAGDVTHSADKCTGGDGKCDGSCELDREAFEKQTSAMRDAPCVEVYEARHGVLEVDGECVDIGWVVGAQLRHDRGALHTYGLWDSDERNEPDTYITAPRDEAALALYSAMGIARNRELMLRAIRDAALVPRGEYAFSLTTRQLQALPRLPQVGDRLSFGMITRIVMDSESFDGLTWTLGVAVNGLAFDEAQAPYEYEALLSAAFLGAYADSAQQSSGQLLANELDR